MTRRGTSKYEAADLPVCMKAAIVVASAQSTILRTTTMDFACVIEPRDGPAKNFENHGSERTFTEDLFQSGHATCGIDSTSIVSVTIDYGPSNAVKSSSSYIQGLREPPEDWTAIRTEHLYPFKVNV